MSDPERYHPSKPLFQTRGERGNSAESTPGDNPATGGKAHRNRDAKSGRSVPKGKTQNVRRFPGIVWTLAVAPFLVVLAFVSWRPVFNLFSKDVHTNSIGMRLAWIAPGEFMMGSPENEKGRDPNDNRIEQSSVVNLSGMETRIIPLGGAGPPA